MAFGERVRNSVLALSAVGLIGIASFEGYRGTAYLDAVGVPTVGFGTTLHLDGTPVRAGDTLSVERAMVRLHQDADAMQREMRRCLGDVPLYPHEWDAFVSLTYNIGATRFCKSTLAGKLREVPPDYAGACSEITRWNRAGGQVLKGLVNRRAAEYRRCVGEDG
jgi:lysozyme